MHVNSTAVSPKGATPNPANTRAVGAVNSAVIISPNSFVVVWPPAEIDFDRLPVPEWPPPRRGGW